MKALYQLVKLRFWGHLQDKECHEFGMSLCVRVRAGADDVCLYFKKSGRMIFKI